MQTQKVLAHEDKYVGPTAMLIAFEQLKTKGVPPVVVLPRKKKERVMEKENENNIATTSDVAAEAAKSLLEEVSAFKVKALSQEELTKKAETDKALQLAAQKMAENLDALEDELQAIYTEAEEHGIDLEGSYLGEREKAIKAQIDDLDSRAEAKLGTQGYLMLKGRRDFSRFLNSIKRTPLNEKEIAAQMCAISKAGRGKLVQDNGGGEYPTNCIVFNDMVLLAIPSERKELNGEQSRADRAIFKTLISIIGKHEEKRMGIMREQYAACADLSGFLKKVKGKYLVAFTGKDDSGSAVVELAFRKGREEDYPVVYIKDGTGAFKHLHGADAKKVFIPYGLLWISDREERENRIKSAIKEGCNKPTLKEILKLAYTIRIQTIALRKQYREEQGIFQPEAA